jgi:hypothetical protein
MPKVNPIGQEKLPHNLPGSTRDTFPYESL